MIFYSSVLLGLYIEEFMSILANKVFVCNLPIEHNHFPYGGTANFCLHIKPSTDLDIAGFSDADWATSIDDRKSIAG